MSTEVSLSSPRQQNDAPGWDDCSLVEETTYPLTGHALDASGTDGGSASSEEETFEVVRALLPVVDAPALVTEIVLEKDKEEDVVIQPYVWDEFLWRTDSVDLTPVE